MKTTLAFMAALVLAAGLDTVQAQDRKFEWLVGGGIDSPLGPNEFKDTFQTGWTVKLAGGYYLTPQFTVGANVSINRFAFDEDNFVTIDNPDISGGDLSVFEFAGVGKYYLMPMTKVVNFYVLGGPGIAHSRISDFKFRNIAGEPVTVEGSNETDFMLTAGAGVKYNVTSRWGVFVEGRYSHLFTESDDTSYLPIRIGVAI